MKELKKFVTSGKVLSQEEGAEVLSILENHPDRRARLIRASYLERHKPTNAKAITKLVWDIHLKGMKLGVIGSGYSKRHY